MSKPVTIDEIVKALEYLYAKRDLIERVEQHGIAPPNGVDWKSLYRFQTAMRYMDNMKSLTKENAYKMADADVASLIASAVEVKP